MKTSVLYVFTGEQASGAEIVIEALMAKNLSAVEPHLFISPGRFADKLIEESKPYNITCLQQLRKLNRSKSNSIVFYAKAIVNYLIISLKVLQYTSKHQIKIVHANTIVAATYLIPAVLFARCFRPKVRWFWSDHDMVYFKKIDHYFSGICCRIYDKTLAVSNAVKLKYSKKPKIEVLHNGLDTSFFKPDTNERNQFRSKYGIADNTIVFAIAGIISPRKRQLELMQAFGKLKQTGYNIQLILAGEYGPDDQQYNNNVKTMLTTLPNVKYIGHINNMVQFYNGCDVIVNNSSARGSEPFGATIYEAMSCEILVMAAKTGGLPEIIDHAINGFLFEPDNETALTQMLGYIIAHFDQLDNIKKQGRIKVDAKFSFSKIARQYNNLLGIKAGIPEKARTALQH